MGPWPHLAEDLVCTTCGATVARGADAALRAATPLSRPPGGRPPHVDPRHGTGDVVWTCDRCSRAHLRSIEAKLDQAWW